jgi:hypothetical protein
VSDTQFLVLLLIIVVIKFIIVGVILWRVFAPDIRQLRQEQEDRKPTEAPACLYCGSLWTEPSGDSETRWEHEELVLVTTYECQHCHLPFWHVERIPVVSSRR